MPASPSPTETPEQALPPGFMPEAEALCSLLGDLGVILAVNMTTDGVFATLAENPRPGAIDVLNVVTQRAVNDDAFRDELISAVASYGFYLADAPSINAALKTAPAADLIQALAKAGLLLRHHYERGDGRSPMLSFMPIPGNPVAPNAHMLMKLAVERFADEPEFAAAMTKFVIETGQSQHDA